MIEWEDKFSMSISIIDDEHKKLIGIINKVILVTVFILTLNVSISYSSESMSDNSEFDVWILAPYTSRASRHRVDPFFNELSKLINKNIRIRTSINPEELYQDCLEKSFDMVLISYFEEETLLNKCNYNLIAQSFQKVILYSTHYREIARLQKVGLIKNIKASLIAKSELPLLIPGVELVEYKDVFDLLLALTDDQVDGFVFNPGAVKTVPLLRKYLPLHEFDEEGVANFLISTKIDDKTEMIIQNFLLKNSQISKTTWQDLYGLGPFEDPSTVLNSNGFRN